jgi:hypothetical protein
MHIAAGMGKPRSIARKGTDERERERERSIIPQHAVVPESLIYHL